MTHEEVMNQRKDKFLKIGRGKGFTNNPESLTTTENTKNNIYRFFQNKKNVYYLFGFIFLIATLVIYFL